MGVSISGIGGVTMSKVVSKSMSLNIGALPISIGVSGLCGVSGVKLSKSIGISKSTGNGISVSSCTVGVGVWLLL